MHKTHVEEQYFWRTDPHFVRLCILFMLANARKEKTLVWLHQLGCWPLRCGLLDHLEGVHT